jgi:hypothetical protein
MFACAIFGSPDLEIANTVFSGNTGTNPSEPMACKVGAATKGTGDLQWPKTKVNGGAAEQPCAPGITFADAALGPLGDHGGPVPTRVPGAGSPALGIGSACPKTDARGHARPADKCAAGAVEP